jgi:hypothetical protein
MQNDLSQQMINLLEKEELPYADDASSSTSRFRGLPKSKKFFPEESINLLERYKPEIREKRIADRFQENIETAKTMGTGLLTGTLALPSDVIEGVNFVNNYLAEQGSPKALLFKDALNKVRDRYGRDAFDKKFTEITGIKSDGTNVDQIIGEVFSPIGAAIKVGSKVTEGGVKLYDFLQEAFNLQTQMLKGDGLTKSPQLVEGVLDNAPEGLNLTTKDKKIITSLAEAAKTSKVVNVEDPNRPLINPSVIAPNAEEVQGFYDIEAQYLRSKGLKPIRSATVADPSGFTPKSEIAKTKDKVSEKNYEQLTLKQKQELYRLSGGIYRGKDGKLRKRVDTRPANLTNLSKLFAIGEATIPEGATLKNFIDFQDIFKNFKNRKGFVDIENIKVRYRVRKDGDTTSAGYIRSDENGDEVIILTTPPEVQFGVPINASLREQFFREQLLHELQHAIQSREGFVNGSSSQAFYPQNYFQNKYATIERDLIRPKENYFLAEGAKADPEAKRLFSLVQEAIIRREAKIASGDKNYFLYTGPNKLFDEIKVGTNVDGAQVTAEEIKKMEIFYNRLRKKGQLDTQEFRNHINGLINRKVELTKEFKKIENEAIDNYFRVFGEQEAYSTKLYDRLKEGYGVDITPPKSSLLFGERNLDEANRIIDKKADMYTVRENKTKDILEMKPPIIVKDKNVQESISLPKFYMGEKGITNNLESFVKIDDFKNADDALLERFNDNAFSISDKFRDNLEKSDLPIERKNKVEIKFDKKFKNFDEEVQRRKKNYSAMYDEIKKYNETLNNEDSEKFTQAVDSAYNNAAETIAENPDNIFGEGATLEELQKNMVEGNLIHDEFFFGNLYDSLINMDADNASSFVASLFEKYR